MDFLELCFSNWFPTPNIVAFTGYNFLSRVTYLNYFVTIYLYIISNKDLSNKPIMKSETISPPLPELSSAFDICYPCRKVSRIVAITDLLPLQTRVILSVEIFITTCIFFFFRANTSEADLDIQCPRKELQGQTLTPPHLPACPICKFSQYLCRKKGRLPK